MTATPEQPSAGWESPEAAAAAPVTQVRYGGFWVRTLAILIDAIALSLISTALAPFMGLGPTVSVENTRLQIDTAANAVSTLVGLVYFIGFWAWRGQTVGMMPFNLQVVRADDGTRIDWVRALLRYVGLIISIIPLFLGVIWAAFDDRRQGWHDKIAGTVVIRTG